jgi:hypothetical protein
MEKPTLRRVALTTISSVVSIGISAWALYSIARPQVAGHPEPRAMQTFQVGGRVVDATTGLPIPNVQVIAESNSPPEPVTAYSDSQGVFVLPMKSGLESPTVRIHANAPWI